MNNNSSRYGKYLMLQFDLSGKIMGASIRVRLLNTQITRIPTPTPSRWL